ncbi:MAG: sigma-70 family RNA polymerase sigma factor [Anaerolineae bacterium]|jgi:RNA polymerase sigma-70 factor (ECF subfamily)
MHQTYATAPARAKSAAEHAELAQAAKEDESAFAALYRRYVDRIYRYVYSRVSRKADAEDLTARIFTEALEGLEDYREQGSFSAWLFTIAHHRVVDHYRRKRTTQPLDAASEIEGDGPNPLAEVVREERLEHLAWLVEGLDEEKQELLRLRFAGELTYREIGEIVGRSEGAVKMAVHRLLRRLEDAWGDENE